MLAHPLTTEALIRFITDYSQRYKRYPTPREIARAFDVSRQAVYMRVHDLVAKGVCVWQYGMRNHRVVRTVALAPSPRAQDGDEATLKVV